MRKIKQNIKLKKINIKKINQKKNIKKANQKNKFENKNQKKNIKKANQKKEIENKNKQNQKNKIKLLLKKKIKEKLKKNKVINYEINYIENFNDETPNNNINNIELVIARYNENISYLNNEQFKNLKIHLYNKGNQIEDIDILNNKNIIIYNLPNVGKCDHTYLEHIIKNYNNLSDLTIFLPASYYYIEEKIKIANKIINDSINIKKAIFPINKLNKTNHKYFNNFKIPYFKTTFKDNQIKNFSNKTVLSSIRPYGKWFEYIYDKNLQKDCYDCDYVIYKGMFSVYKNMILKYDINFYKNMIKFIDKNINPEAGHFIERTWACLFYPFENSLLFTNIYISKSDLKCGI